jgi:hypothetical protein
MRGPGPKAKATRITRADKPAESKATHVKT